MNERFNTNLKEQLSLNDYIRREFLHKKYNLCEDCTGSSSIIKPGQAAIVPKIDWFSIMLSNQSIFDIFCWLGIADEFDFSDEVLNCFYQASVGYDERLFFSFNGINISFSLFDVKGIDVDTDFFSLQCPRVKLDLTGTGLDYIRGLGIDIDEFLRDFNNFSIFDSDSFSITRCDFAFDLLNWQPDFLKQMFDYVQNHHTPSNRLCCVGLASNFAFSERHGSDETLYIGSPQSDKLLRIYDKRLQYIDRETGAYIKDNYYSNPNSWIRLEWQLRNKKAIDVLFGIGDFFSIWKKIYESYPFADMNTPAHRRLKADFWEKLFKADEDFIEIKSLLLNKNIHFVQLNIPRDTRISKDLPFNLSRYVELLFFLKSRNLKFETFVNDAWIFMQRSTDDPGLELKRKKRIRAIGARLAQHSNYFDMKSLVLKTTDGFVQFR